MQFFKQNLSVRDLSNLRLSWGCKFIEQLAIATIILIGFNSIAWAQRRPIADETLGNERSIVTPDVINGRDGDRIDGGARRGENLFHSFREFSVDEGRAAYFSNPSGVRNILSRVTGSNISEILGTLGVLGDANLFFLNPNGIIFGPNARLDIRGSFLASTGDRFVFADGSEFSATNPQTAPLLTVSITPGLQLGAQTGSIVNRGDLTVGQDLTLAGVNLDLEGQLHAGGNLTLLAQDTVRVRDTASTAFAATSGQNLTLQGNGGIDILALQHPEQTPFVSGGALSLISDGVISADAHFTSGGNFQIRSLSGQPAQFTSLYDPIISSAANVDIAGGYEGASLLIESQGNVRIQGAVTITAPDTVSSFVGADTVLSNRPGLIIRSGQTDLVYSSVNQGGTPTFSFGDMPAGIMLGGAVRVIPNEQGGVVNLTAARGDITVASIDTSNLTGGDGGSITLTAETGSITTTDTFRHPRRGDISLGSFTFSEPSNASEAGDAGSGGAISLTAGSTITTGALASSSFSFSTFEPSDASAGGLVALTASGNITTGDIFSDSSSYSGNTSDGGATTLIAGGNITTGNLSSSSFSLSKNGGNAGNGGTIKLTADGGTITTGSIFSSSVLESDNLESDNNGIGGNTGDGGKIILTADSAITTGDLSSYSFSLQSYTGDGGEIELTAGSTIATGDISSYSSSRESNAGNGGGIRLSAGSTIATGDISSYSSSTPADASNGGEIALTAGGIIATGDISSYSSSRESNAGNGGGIRLSAKGGIIPNSSTSLNSFSVSEAGSSGNGGKVTLEAGGEVSALGVNTVASGNLAGNVEITGFGDLQVDNTRILTAQQVEVCFLRSCTSEQFTKINLSDIGQAGKVTVTSPGSLVFSNSRIESDTRGANLAGNIIVEAKQGITITDGSNISARTVSSGTAGSITFTAPTLVIAGNARVLAETEPTSTGNGGSIFVNAPTSVDLRRIDNLSPVLSVETRGAGEAGNITITTPSLTLSEQARITATATETATNSQGGGSITINASNLNLAGTVGVFAETQSVTPAGTLTLRPDNGRPNLDVDLSGGAQISASTSSSGRGGNLDLSAPEAITIQGNGRLSVETTGTGRAGDITITAPRLTIADGAEVSASTSNIGEGGRLTVNAPASVLLSNQGQLLTESTGSGRAGNLAITTPQLTLEGGSKISASNLSSSGGDINLAVGDSLKVSDNSQISASTQSGQGGNVTIRGLDTLRVLNSLISAESETGTSGVLNVNASDSIVLRGIGAIADKPNRGGLSVRSNGGLAGTLNITTNQLNIQDGASIAVSNSGLGNAGGLTIQARDVFLDRGSITGTTEAGRGGNVQLRDLNSLNLDNSSIAASTQTGQGGSLQITTKSGGNITLNNNSRLASEATEGGNAGSLTIDNVDRLSLQDGSSMTVRSTETGRAGDLSVNAQTVLLNRRSTITGTTEAGRGGDINLSIDQALRLNNNSQISASTQSGPGGAITIEGLDALRVLRSLISAESATGQAGRLRVNASDSVLLDGKSDQNQGGLSVRSGGGVAGNLRISTDRLNIRDGASITVSNTVQGDAGDLTVNARNVFLDRGRIAGTTEGGEAGNIQLEGLDSLRLDNQSEISASTEAGRGGRLQIRMRDGGNLALNNGSRLATEATEGGDAGALMVDNVDSLTLQDGSNVTVSSTRQGAAGDLTVNARRVSLEDGSVITGTTQAGIGGDTNLTIADSLRLNNNSRISASTWSGQGGNVRIRGLDTLQVLDSLISAESGTGKAGQLRVNVSDSVLLDGRGEQNQGGLSVQSRSGRAGGLNVTTNELDVQDGAAIAVTSREGKAGNLGIDADSVTLNSGNLEAIAGAGDDGNINLNVSGRLLRLSNGSQITARARNNATGGNVTLEVPDGFIVANPYGNNDILANADQGNGGQINITTQSIFGLQQRDIESSFSDINASSEFGLDGTIELNTLNINPAQGLAALPENVTPPIQVDQRCAVGTRSAVEERGEFVVTGRGGLPPDADESLGGNAVDVDLVTTAETATAANRSVSLPETGGIDEAIVEAQGWVVANNGDLVLTAAAPTATPDHSQHNAICTP